MLDIWHIEIIKSEQKFQDLISELEITDKATEELIKQLTDTVKSQKQCSFENPAPTRSPISHIYKQKFSRRI